MTSLQRNIECSDVSYKEQEDFKIKVVVQLHSKYLGVKDDHYGFVKLGLVTVEQLVMLLEKQVLL
jgi:hypothetical protein